MLITYLHTHTYMHITSIPTGHTLTSLSNPRTSCALHWLESHWSHQLAVTAQTLWEGVVPGRYKCISALKGRQDLWCSAVVWMQFGLELTVDGNLCVCVCVCVLVFNHNLHSNCRICIATAKARQSPVTDNAPM